MADLTTRNILQSYISKIFVNTQLTNNDVVTISSEKLSLQGDLFELDTRVISPNIIETTQSLNELQPEISEEYPFKVVVPTDDNGFSLIYSPTIEYEVTASQSYYAPVYFERYELNVIREIDKNFLELEEPIEDDD